MTWPYSLRRLLRPVRQLGACRVHQHAIAQQRWLTASAAASSISVDPLVHPTLASAALRAHPGSVALAYRRALLGSINEKAPRRFAACEAPTPPTAAVAEAESSSSSSSSTRRVPFLLAHCLLGDSRQFTLFESHLHTVLRAWNEATPHAQMILDVWNVDLRNHGASPHVDRHGLAEIVTDLRAFLAQHRLQRPVLCGHSMGGKSVLALALALALDASNNKTDTHAPAGVIALDAAPAAYTHAHSSIFGAMAAIDFADSTLLMRRDVEHRLKAHLPSPSDRAFVLANLVERVERTPAPAPVVSDPSPTDVQASDSSSPPTNAPPKFAWRCNLPIIHRDESRVHGWPMPVPVLPPSVATAPAAAAAASESPLVYRGPVLFIGGAKSSRLTTPEYTRDIPHYFPQHHIEMLPSAAHFVHQSHGRECAEMIAQFLREQV